MPTFALTDKGASVISRLWGVGVAAKFPSCPGADNPRYAAVTWPKQQQLGRTPRITNRKQFADGTAKMCYQDL